MSKLSKDVLDDYADIMSQFGLTPTAALAPEEIFFNFQIEGAAPRVDNMLYWLKHEMAHLEHMIDEGMKITLNILKDGKMIDRPITRTEYGRSMVRYWLQMMHLTCFIGGDRKLDLDKTVALFMDYPGVKKIIGHVAS